MTMFSADDHTRRFCGAYAANYLPSDLLFGMADEQESPELDQQATDSESHERDQEWLQLSIGPKNNNISINNGGAASSALIELDLMPATIRQDFIRPPRPPLPNFGSFFLQNHAEINWAFRPIPISIAAAVPSSSSSYSPRPFPPPAPDFRVIQPPRRPHSGVWFMLQASLNQDKLPFLPQISKSYLRIKDGRMTVRLVMKYLVNKLSLEDESEIEIRCKGQRLLPSLTLQHVRDNIWSSPRDFITLLPNSSTTHHIMVLHYARTDPSN